MNVLFLASLAHATVLRHAVVVGANYGGSGLDPLRYAESDATRIGDLLLELGGFDPVYVTVLYAPTAAELKAALHEHSAISSSFDDDLFLFYYSGHADARGLRIGTEAYAYEALRSDIRAMPSEVKIGMLDACRSGTITRLKGAALSQPFLVQDRLAAEGEAWITAASADESAQESDRLRGSFFTHYLISGMRGAADTGDGEVSLQEAYNYASARVIDQTGGTLAGAQHPNYDYRLKGERDPALTRVSQGRATATLPADLVGQVTVSRLPDRTPVAEVAKVAGQPVTLALAPGNYKIRLQQGKEFREAEIMLSDGARMTLSRWGASNVEAGSVKGGTFALDSRDLARKTADAGRNAFIDLLNPNDLRHSPLLAGGISAVGPGGGQFYNGQWAKGTLYLGTVGSLFAASVFSNQSGFFTGAITGPDPLMMTAAMFYGAAMADASYNADRREEWRPNTGVSVATYSAWDPRLSLATPYVAGITADWHFVPNVSIGLDRFGWTRSPDGEERWNFGTRAMFAIEGKHVRPALFVGFGGRVIDTRVEAATRSRLVGTVGAGGNFRWYVTPRYFIENEVRVESEGGRMVILAGGGVGVHIGGE